MNSNKDVYMTWKWAVSVVLLLATALGGGMTATAVKLENHERRIVYLEEMYKDIKQIRIKTDSIYAAIQRNYK